MSWTLCNQIVGNLFAVQIESCGCTVPFDARPSTMQRNENASRPDFLSFSLKHWYSSWGYVCLFASRRYVFFFSSACVAERWCIGNWQSVPACAWERPLSTWRSCTIEFCHTYPYRPSASSQSCVCRATTRKCQWNNANEKKLKTKQNLCSIQMQRNTLVKTHIMPLKTVEKEKRALDLLREWASGMVCVPCLWMIAHGYWPTLSSSTPLPIKFPDWVRSSILFAFAFFYRLDQWIHELISFTLISGWTFCLLKRRPRRDQKRDFSREIAAWAATRDY